MKSIPATIKISLHSVGHGALFDYLKAKNLQDTSLKIYANYARVFE